MGQSKSKMLSPDAISVKKKGFLYYLKRDWQLYALMLLPMAFIIVFKYFAYTGLSVAFLDYKIGKGYAGSKFVGLKVFEKVFKHRDFGKAVANTLLLNVLDVMLLPAVRSAAVMRWFTWSSRMSLSGSSSMSGTTNFARRGAFAFFLGTAGRLPRRCCSTYSPQTEQATSRSGSSRAPRTNAAIATIMPTKMLVPFRMALSDFIVDYRPFTKTKRAASGVHSEHVMQPKVRPLSGGHAGCGLILGSLPFCQWQEISI